MFVIPLHKGFESTRFVSIIVEMFFFTKQNKEKETRKRKKRKQKTCGQERVDKVAKTFWAEGITTRKGEQQQNLMKRKI